MVRAKSRSVFRSPICCHFHSDSTISLLKTQCLSNKTSLKKCPHSPLNQSLRGIEPLFPCNTRLAGNKSRHKLFRRIFRSISLLEEHPNLSKANSIMLWSKVRAFPRVQHTCSINLTRMLSGRYVRKSISIALPATPYSGRYKPCLTFRHKRSSL